MIISLMKVVKVGVLIPAAMSSLWLIKPGLHSPRLSVAGAQAQVSDYGPQGELIIRAPQAIDEDPALLLHSQASSDGSEHAANEIVYSRRARVENILGALNRINEVSMQMDPDRAAALEPVLMDIAEEAMALSDRSIISKSSTDLDLVRIESTVKKLSHAVARAVEPEMSL